MKDVLVIGSGIAGLACAIRCAENNVRVTLVSPHPSERAQSVMAAGGINAVTAQCEEGDSVACHIDDTLSGGCWIAGRNAVTGLCVHAEGIINYLEHIGTVFSIDEQGKPRRRAFGGQSHKRTFFCGSSTGKQIVSALVMEARRHEARGTIVGKLHLHFYSALIEDGVCYGALLFDELHRKLIPVNASAVVMATGGQNALFGKTTGSVLCDGYAAGKLFMQGALLKNLEFIQFHPTTLETDQKRMLVTEAVRGEGGRLFYEEGGRRVYFMEDKYGPGGNLMTRDVVSREIHAASRDVFLDISFLDRCLIDERLQEARDLCLKYRGIDVATQPIPVAPSVHFFMGGLAVHLNHETSIERLYAVGECASMYHGANRLGGNSLLAALYSGRVAADDVCQRADARRRPSFAQYIAREERRLAAQFETQSPFPVAYMRDMLAETMHESMGIVRTEESLAEGIAGVEYYQSIAEHLRYDASTSAYANYSFAGILATAHASLACALARKESRGAHYRADAPQSHDDFAYGTLVSYDDGAYRTWLDRERAYEN
ncbi:MAG: FAD-binding protein [Atopobiaceae bacterium]|nr:FAD-binding protein [Atopobiaceae bacterium]